MDVNKGSVIIITGDGKGKTTTALGEAFKFWLNGKKVLVLQFIKGSRVYGELKAAEKLGPNFIIKQMGLGFVRSASEEKIAEHRAAAHNAIKEAKASILSGDYDLIILDELLYSIGFGLIEVEDVITNLIKPRPESLSLILTGRNAPADLVDLADHVVEAKELKHHFKQGIPAQAGIEF